MTSHTPGPWQWVKRQYPTSKTIELVHPNHGYLIVMDFVRLGMQSGTFRLATWNGDERENMGGIMRPAHEIDVNAHPDARLIASAPDLLAACEAVLARMDYLTQLWGDEGVSRRVRDQLRAAVAKARGTTPTESKG